MNSYTLIKVKQNYLRKIKKNHWGLLKPSYSKETKAHVIGIGDLLAEEKPWKLQKANAYMTQKLTEEELKVSENYSPIPYFQNKTKPKKSAFSKGLRPQTGIL